MIANNKEQFLSHLQKTVSWCKGRADTSQPKLCLRSKELKKIVESHGENPAAIWNSSRLITDVLQARNELLVDSGIGEDCKGRILLCAYDYTNHNTLTDLETNGFFDEHDNPPWDTWICEIQCLHGESNISAVGESWPPNLGSILGDGDPVEVILAAWIPIPFFETVQNAIDVECVGMLFWADSLYPESSVAPKYKEIIPEWFKKIYETRP